VATVQIESFIEHIAELAFKCAISDPPLVMDLAGIGKKVEFTQFKYDCVDGFVKADQECYIILPSVHKLNTTSVSGAHQSQSGGQIAGQLGEVVLKANVLAADYEFP